MSFRCHLVIALLAAFVSSEASAALYTVGPPGTPGSCSHASLYDAVEAARLNSGPDEIRVTSNGGQATGMALVIENQALVLRGGFADCATSTRTGRTLMGGAGGAFAPVLWVRSSSDGSIDVTLDGLELVAGDSPNNMAGGGLAVRGQGTVRISHSRIANNVAGFGGGIGIDGLGTVDNTLIEIGDGVQIEDNQAVGGGGGIYLHHARATLGGIDTVVRRNRAPRGGGISVSGAGDPMQPVTRIDIRSGGEGADGIVSGNTASADGGGLHLEYGAEVLLYSTDPTRAVRLDHNVAGGNGGAVHVSGARDRVAIWEARVEANEAQFGGAFSVWPLASLSLASANAADAPSGTVSCAPTLPCNRVIDNRADFKGAILSVLMDNRLPAASARFESTLFADHHGPELFAEFCDFEICSAPPSIEVRNSRIGPNPDTPTLLAVTNGTAFTCDLCTITGNGASTPTPPLIGSNGPLTLSRSILFEPGRDVIGGLAPQSLRVAHLLAHDASDLGINATVLVADPHFVDVAAGDYRLAADSPALDFAPLTPDVGFDWITPPVDLDGKPRVFDQPAVNNLAGPVDLGAYERPDPNAVFADGFE